MPCQPTCQCPLDTDAHAPPLCGQPTRGKTCMIEGVLFQVCDDCAREIQTDPENALVLDLLYGTTRPDSCKSN